MDQSQVQEVEPIEGNRGKIIPSKEFGLLNCISVLVLRLYTLIFGCLTHTLIFSST